MARALLCPVVTELDEDEDEHVAPVGVRYI